MKKYQQLYARYTFILLLVNTIILSILQTTTCQGTPAKTFSRVCVQTEKFYGGNFKERSRYCLVLCIEYFTVEIGKLFDEK